MSNSANTKRIAKNTGLLYIRTLLTMFVSLYTSRVVLNTLGVEDFGIYNVVGGIVVMFSFLNSAMSSATQRYFSFELGQGNTDQLKKLFSITVNIHFLIAIVITILAETIGLWFLNTKLNIPADKMYEANWVFQFSIATFFLTVISVPYNAAIISHERMGVYAYVSIIEVLGKLVIVYILLLTKNERLIWYAGMLFGIALCVRVFYGIYCSRKFSECRFIWVNDKSKSIELIHYAGWNLFTNLSWVIYSQGISFFLNIFFGLSLNATNGIGNQVSSAISSFVANFQTAINPQIVKSYASGDLLFMRNLILQGSKLSFFLLLIVALPVIYNIDFILKIWLENVPDYTSIFTILILANSLIKSLSVTLATSVQATGRIKMYQLTTGIFLMTNIPVSYIFLNIGFPPQIVLYVMIVISCMSLFTELVIASKLNVINLKIYLYKVVFRVSVVCLFSFILLRYLLLIVEVEGIIGFVLRVSTIEFVILSLILIIGFSKNERVYYYNVVKNKYFK
ncbi:MAG: oligosaccharide flippase family protein [Tannerellaceae bacterium]